MDNMGTDTPASAVSFHMKWRRARPPSWFRKLWIGQPADLDSHYGACLLAQLLALREMLPRAKMLRGWGLRPQLVWPSLDYVRVGGLSCFFSRKRNLIN